MINMLQLTIQLILLQILFLSNKGVRGQRNLKQINTCKYDYIDPACQAEDAIQDMIMGSSVQIASSKDYPFMVSLQYADREPSPFSEGCFTHFCGGTLISSNMLLTAAHCFDAYLATGELSGQPSSPIYVVISPQCRHMDNRDNKKRIPINQVFIHPDYDRNSNNADLAVVTLLGMFDDTPISIDDGSQDLSEGNNGNNLTVVGYGYTRPEERLLKVVYPVHQAALNYVSDEAVCQGLLQIAGTDTSYLNYKVMFCAYAVGADTCQGDSGGPLMAQTQSGWKQVGIVSWGPASQCSSTSVTQAVGVFTRISTFTNWISQMINMYSVDVTTVNESSDKTKATVLELNQKEDRVPLGRNPTLNPSIFATYQASSDREPIRQVNSGVGPLELLAALELPDRVPIGQGYRPEDVKVCDYINGRKLQQILGEDNRITVSEQECYPIFGIGKMYLEDSTCGITMIKDDVAITVGSCFNKQSKEVLEGPLLVEFQNGWTVGVREMQFIEQTNTNISYAELFYYTPAKLEGVAVIVKLQASVGYLTGWLGLPKSESGNLSIKVSMTEFGDYRMTRQECALQGAGKQDNLVYHDCDTALGKGWPLYTIDSGKFILVALHASPSVRGPKKGELSKGLSLQSTLSTFIRNSVQEGGKK